MRYTKLGVSLHQEVHPIDSEPHQG
jgi:hypothetical protein